MPICKRCGQKKSFWEFSSDYICENICSECAQKQPTLDTIDENYAFLTIVLRHLSGLENLPIIDPDEDVKLTINPKKKKIYFNNHCDNSLIASLAISKITSIREVIKNIPKNKNLIGRAAIGGLMFGSAGAVVGALTAFDEETDKIPILIFCYTSNGQEKEIIMACTSYLSSGYKKFLELLPNSPYTPGNSIGPVEL